VIDASAYKQMIFEVGEVWKGEGLVKRDEILLFAPEGDCSFDFRVGELYLVYATYNIENMLTTSTCDRTAQLSEAQADLDLLGQGYDDSIAASAPEREEEIVAAQDDEANTAVEGQASIIEQMPLIAGVEAAIAVV
ncbi:MAG: hypothetical protein M3114_06240, partial [Thermoproteota archaeon]|nr:hypothetical protein [Thermoproteota archaeon]